MWKLASAPWELEEVRGPDLDRWCHGECMLMLVALGAGSEARRVQWRVWSAHQEISAACYSGDEAVAFGHAGGGRWVACPRPCGVSVFCDVMGSMARCCGGGGGVTQHRLWPQSDGELGGVRHYG